MAEEQGEKTEQASAHKREEAIKEGRFAESPDVSTAAGLAVGLAVLSALGGSLMSSSLGLMKSTFGGIGAEQPLPFYTQRLTPALSQAATPALLFLAIVAAGAVVSNIAQVGLHLNLGWLSPKWERMSPANALKEIFSGGSLVALLIGILKLGAIGWSAYAFVAASSMQMRNWNELSNTQLMLKTGETAMSLGWRIAIPLLVLSLADYGYKRYQHEKSLMMTKEEAKEEMKQQEGDPKIKQRIRQIQRQRANRRMMRDVPKATVVLANPTHVAIALQYVAGQTGAPIVLAKGENLVAERIKAIAREAGVPVLENPPLARALLRVVEVGREIPAEFYRAVAEVLAQLYRRGAAGRVA